MSAFYNKLQTKVTKKAMKGKKKGKKKKNAKAKVLTIEQEWEEIIKMKPNP